MGACNLMSANSEDITALYISEHARLERQISRRVRCRSTAADLVHDIFLRLWEKATVWNGDGRAYLTRCARNAAIDYARSEQARARFLSGFLPEQYAQAPATPDEILSAKQTMRSLDAALAALPRRTRHIFILNRIHGRSFSEIAGVMEISRRTVATHMARAIKACVDIRTD